MVVPNSLAEVPRAEGLLAFIMSNNSLYLRANSSWRSIAEQKEVKNIYFTELNYIIIVRIKSLVIARHATPTATTERKTT